MSGLSFRPEGEYASALESERPDSNDFSKKYKFSFMKEINLSTSGEARPSARYIYAYEMGSLRFEYAPPQTLLPLELLINSDDHR